MLITLSSPATQDQINQALSDFDGYFKFVVDVEKNIATIGGLRHFDGEQMLLQSGSKQSDLWGGGIDWQNKGLDFESMINIRPSQDNPSREVLNTDVRKKITQVLVSLNLWTN